MLSAYIFRRPSLGSLSRYVSISILVCVLIFLQPRFLEIPSCFSFCAAAVLACHLILNLCEAFYGDEQSLSTSASVWAANWASSGSAVHPISLELQRETVSILVLQIFKIKIKCGICQGDN